MAIPGEKPWANSHLILERQEEKRTVPETVENDVTYSPSKKKKKIKYYGIFYKYSSVTLNGRRKCHFHGMTLHEFLLENRFPLIYICVYMCGKVRVVVEKEYTQLKNSA